MEYLRVELKICEGCGSLWYRTELLDKVYCAPCSKRLAMHAKARPEQRRGRRAAHTVSMQAIAGGAR